MLLPYLLLYSFYLSTGSGAEEAISLSLAEVYGSKERDEARQSVSRC